MAQVPRSALDTIVALLLITANGVVAVSIAQDQANQIRTLGNESTIISGRVVDPNGTPVGQASVSTFTRGEQGVQQVERAVSGAEGEFKFTWAKPEIGTGPFRTIVGNSKGFGMAVTQLSDLTKADNVVLRLVKDQPIRGRLIDSQGQPVAAARITVESVTVVREENFSAYLKALRDKNRIEVAKAGNGRIEFFPKRLDPIVTDGDGHFVLEGIGSNRRARLAIESPLFAHDRISVVVGAENLTTQEDSLAVYGSEFVHIAKPARSVRGIVRDRDGDKPLAGITISSYPSMHRPKTDTNGRFEIQGVARADEYVVQAIPLDGQPYFVNGVSARDVPGTDPVEVEIELYRGLVIQGRLTDKETGKPIKAQIGYYPLINNKHYTGQTGWAARTGSAGTGSFSYPSTQSEDGSFTIPVFPGPGAIVCRTMSDAYESASVDPSKFFKDGKSYGDSSFLQLPPTIAGAAGIRTPQSQYQAIGLINPSVDNPDSLKVELTMTRKSVAGGSK